MNVRYSMDVGFVLESRSISDFVWAILRLSGVRLPDFRE